MEISNIGLLKEENMVLQLNDNRFKDIVTSCKYLLNKIFGHIDDDTIIKSEIIPGYQKPDFSITVNDVTKYISMKNGINCSLQQLDIDKFCLYLKDNGISETTIETLKIYHYGDGTTDGSGEKRLPYNMLMTMLAPRLRLANEEINADKDFVWKTVEKCMFKSFSDWKIPADFIYIGDYESGSLVSSDQIRAEILDHSYAYYENPHVGPLLFRPHARYAGKRIKNDKYRRSVDFYWPNMEANLRRIERRYNAVFTKSKFKH